MLMAIADQNIALACTKGQVGTVKYIVIGLTNYFTVIRLWNFERGINSLVTVV